MTEWMLPRIFPILNIRFYCSCQFFKSSFIPLTTGKAGTSSQRQHLHVAKELHWQPAQHHTSEEIVPTVDGNSSDNEDMNKCMCYSAV